MLAEFRVEGFKNFEKELAFRLDDVKNYEFSAGAVRDGFVKTGAVYGFNGSGKTNLAHAIFDITLHLVEREKSLDFYQRYKNLKRISGVKFHYRFRFGKDEIVYEYEKWDAQSLLAETVIINGKEVISYEYCPNKKNKAVVSLKGAESLSLEFETSNKPYYKLSVVKYVFKNTRLKPDRTNGVFQKMLDFVERMLLFSSLDDSHYVGFKNGKETISDGIIDAGKVKEFEHFLRKAGIEYQLENDFDDNEIMCYYKIDDNSGTGVDFFSIASRGTKSLALFYYWLIQLHAVSLVVIDEFDAFYHSELAKTVVEELIKHEELQALVTTHNTDILTNDLLRPDCYFLLQDGEIHSFANLTDKELRKAHNLQKMYKAGAFNA